MRVLIWKRCHGEDPLFLVILDCYVHDMQSWADFKIWTSVNVSLDFFWMSKSMARMRIKVVIWKSFLFFCDVLLHPQSPDINVLLLSSCIHFQWEHISQRNNRKIKKAIKKFDQHKMSKFKNIDQERSNRLLYTQNRETRILTKMDIKPLCKRMWSWWKCGKI